MVVMKVGFGGGWVGSSLVAEGSTERVGNTGSEVGVVVCGTEQRISNMQRSNKMKGVNFWFINTSLSLLIKDSSE
jgi:hypothetical protein